MAWETELELARRLAGEAGALLRVIAAGELKVLSEEAKDIKLQADKDAEALILDGLHRESPYPILSEEAGEQGQILDGPFWVVDPLDGTANFARGIPICAVSIALVEGTQARVGVIYDFNRDELFSAAQGGPALLNGTPMRVSGRIKPAISVLATGFPQYRDFSTETIMPFVHKVQAFKKVRLIGSAAISMAWVACGRFDAYTEEDIMLWDIAAGLALVEAAGGVIQLAPSLRHKWGFTARIGATTEILAEV